MHDWIGFYEYYIMETQKIDFLLKEMLSLVFLLSYFVAKQLLAYSYCAHW